MADTWWFEETKLLIALWSEEAVQHEFNTVHNKKLLWDKLSQGMADGGSIGRHFVFNFRLRGYPA